MVVSLVVKCVLCGKTEGFTSRDKTNPRDMAAKAGWIECYRSWKCSCRKQDVEQDIKS